LGDVERDETPGRPGSCVGNEKPNATENLEEAADVDERQGGGQELRNDSDERFRPNEVEDANGDHDAGEEEEGG
jgi:hypothetical protein